MHKAMSVLVILSILFQAFPAAQPETALSAAPQFQVDEDLLILYTFPGEKVYTLYPGLEYMGSQYLLHYFTTGDYNETTSRFINAFSESFQESHAITGLLLTANGNVVQDEDIIRNILALYRSAYYLYEERNPDWLGYVPDGMGDEMHTLATITSFTTLSFPNETNDTAEALRLMFSSRVAAPGLIQEVGEFVADKVEEGLPTVDAVDLALTNYRFSNNKSVRLAGKSMKESLYDWHILPDDRSKASLAGKVINVANGLKLIPLAADLFWLTEIQRDRADWLAHYQTYASGEAALSYNQSEAAALVSIEAENNWAQRVNIIREFVVDEALDWLVDHTVDDLVRSWTKFAFKKYGTRIVGHVVAGLATNALLGITIGNLIYGFEDVNECFWLGIRMDDLRSRFRTARVGLEDAVRIQSVPYYDGTLSERYRSAYMLESLAAARMLSSYADGVDATVRDGLTALINPIKWFVGDDWQEAAEGLRELSVQAEQTAEDNVGHPAFIDTAVASILTRISQVQMLVDDSSANFSKVGPEGNWEQMEGGYGGSATWTYNEALNQHNSGRWQFDLPEAGLYRIDLYIPPSAENLPSYTHSAMYTIFHFDQPEPRKLDMQSAEGGWLDMGVFYLEDNGEEYVELGDLTSEPSGEAILVYDALRLTPEEMRDEYYQASPGAGLIYKVVLPGETANLEFNVTNSGVIPWYETGNYTFQPTGTTKFTLPIFPITQTVLPGQSLQFSLDIPVSADALGGLETIKYVVTRSGTALEKPITAYLFVLPPQLADYREQLEQKIEEWTQEGEQAIENLVQRILDDIQRELASQIEKKVNEWTSQCFSPSLFLGAMAIILARRRRSGAL
ncbi:MAG: hypothetical protein MUC85_13525 [Anaerolineales bacterium]|nr:hypothetical protein [Anaerolineales bacterium]